MTPPLTFDGWSGFAIVLMIAVLVQEPWRWLGLYLGRSIAVDGELFSWVRQVATALVAALVARLVIFPPGDLADVSLHFRLAAIAVGLIAFYVSRRSLAVAVLAGTAALLTAQVMAS